LPIKAVWKLNRRAGPAVGGSTRRMAPGTGNDTYDGWHRLRILLLESPNHLFVLPGAVMSAFGGVISLTVLSILGLRRDRCAA